MSSTAPPACPDLRGRTRPGGVADGVIHVRAARGRGRTALSAFDDALQRAGVADLNLLPLSSVIPPGVDVVVDHDPPPLTSVHGDRLYCVMSVAHAGTRGESAWAGLGWVNRPGQGGLFVEHHAHTEHMVRGLIDLTLGDMTRRRGGDWGRHEQSVIEARCTERPSCALVIAAYAAEGWGHA